MYHPPKYSLWFRPGPSNAYSQFSSQIILWKLNQIRWLCLRLPHGFSPPCTQEFSLSFPTLHCNAPEDLLWVFKCPPSFHFLTCLTIPAFHSIPITLLWLQTLNLAKHVLTWGLYIHSLLWLELSPRCDAGNIFFTALIKFYNINKTIFEHTR